MSIIKPRMPSIGVGTIVVTPSKLNNITVDKKYVVEGVYEGHVIVRDDLGDLRTYNMYNFIEADIYFTMCLLSTLAVLFDLAGKVYN